jgi:hypothetical protein
MALKKKGKCRKEMWQRDSPEIQNKLYGIEKRKGNAEEKCGRER